MEFPGYFRVTLIYLLRGQNGSPLTMKKVKVEQEEEEEEEKGQLSVNLPTSDKLTVDDVMNYIGFGPFQVVALLLAGISSFSFSLDAALFSFIAEPVQKEWGLNAVQFAILPSMTGVANILGGFFYGYLSDTFGRVWPYALCALNIAVFSLASAFSPNFYTLVALRFGTSFGITACLGLLYTMLVEFLPVRNRGKALIALFLVQSLTSCLTGGLAWWLIPSYKRYGWRYLTLATASPAVVTTIYRVAFHTESPRFLITKGRYKAARKVLARMAKMNGKNLEDFVPREEEFRDIVATDSEQRQGKLFSQTLRNFIGILKPKYLRMTLALAVINITSAGTFWGASLFLPSLLADLTTNSYFIAFMGYLGQIPGILLMLIIVEWRHVGRLNSLRFYTILSIVAFMLFGLVQNEVATPVLTILIYFSMIPLSALVSTYSSECYPTTVRAMATNLFNNIGAFVNIFTPYIGGYTTDLFRRHPWLFSVVWVAFYTVQFVTSFLLAREPLGMMLQDSG